LKIIEIKFTHRLRSTEPPKNPAGGEPRPDDKDGTGDDECGGGDAMSRRKDESF
tara:strand:- start:162 stop:323 length:162 start_codon:yes stop_codon:yes gene_type:complete